MKKSDQVKQAERATRQDTKDFELEAERWINFGEWMKQRRIDLRMNQLTAGRKAGLSRVQWARIENGDGTKFTTIPRIARALGYVTTEQIQEVYRLAGFNVGQETPNLPAALRLFPDLPVEIQQDIARRIEREYELELLKKEKRGRK